MAGAESQGPATANLTAIHHNPAMLASLPAFDFALNGQFGVDRTTFRPPGATERNAAINPAADGFFAASVGVETLTLALGLYTLGNRLRSAIPNGSSAHAIGDPDRECGRTGDECPAKPTRGGVYEVRSDLSVAVAWQPLEIVRLGAGLHFPFSATRLSRDEAAGSTHEDPLCVSEPNAPRCRRRLNLETGSSVRVFARDRDDASRLDFALTVGIGVTPHPRLRLGARFRTPTLLEGGFSRTFGAARHCPIDERGTPTAACELPGDTVVMEERTTMAAAFGASIDLDRRARWKLDINFVWQDRCPGRRSTGCSERNRRFLAALELEPNAELHERPLWRGHSDLYAVELWSAYRLRKMDTSTKGPSRTRTGVHVLAGIGFASPAVELGAITVAETDAWEISGTLGARFEFPLASSFVAIAPGYGFDIAIPVRIGPDGVTSRFEPNAREQFESSGFDVNTSAAKAVLDGRDRPTNAGTYTSSTHTFSINLRWGQRETN